MPDYPYVYGAGAPQAVASGGGTRVRVFRRRRREPEQQDTGEDTGTDRGGDGADSWREALARAVDDLNESLRRSGAALRCSLEEDAGGLTLVILEEGREGPPVEIEEELLHPEELPQWLQRLRTRLGLIFDATV
ncbi:MAG: hypothetical protein Kow0092_34630 [Deferrisomatales bacterium]